MNETRLPDGWSWVRLEEVCLDITDGTHFTPTYVSEGVPFLSVKNVRAWGISFEDCRYITKDEHEKLTKRCKPERGDVLYTKVGTTGIAKAIDFDREFSIFVSVALLKLKPSVLPEYLEKALNSPICRIQADALTQGMANRNLVIRDIKRIEFPLPPLAEQQRIAAAIDAQMAEIDAARAGIEAELEAAEALLDSEIRSIYEMLLLNYDVVDLGSLITNADYGTSIKCNSERTQGAAPVLRIPNIVFEYINFDDMKYGILTHDEFQKLRLIKGDILIVRTNGSSDLVGRCAVVVELPEPMVFASYLIRIHCDEDLVMADYVGVMLKHLRNSRQLLNFAHSSAGQFNVSLGRLRSASLPLPPLEKQAEIVTTIKAKEEILNEMHSSLIGRFEAITAMPAAVLRRAFNGEL